MNHENYTPIFTGVQVATIQPITLLLLRHDGQYYETRTVTEKEFYNLNEAKRFAKENV